MATLSVSKRRNLLNAFSGNFTLYLTVLQVVADDSEDPDPVGSDDFLLADPGFY